MRRCAAGSSREPYTCRISARARISLTSVDFPEPDTPVTAVKVPSGNGTSTPVRLFAVASRTTIAPAAGLRRAVGTAIERRPAR